jgi:hypothetical protein
MKALILAYILVCVTLTSCTPNHEKMLEGKYELGITRTIRASARLVQKRKVWHLGTLGTTVPT